MRTIFNIEINKESFNKEIFRNSVEEITDVKIKEDSRRGLSLNVFKWIVSIVAAPKAIEKFTNVLIHTTEGCNVKIKKGDDFIEIKNISKKDIGKVLEFMKSYYK